MKGVFSFCAALAAAASQAFGVFEALGDLPGLPYHTEALAVSGDGYFVAGAASESAFLWNPGVGLTPLLGPEGGTTTAYALNRDGFWVVGSQGTATLSEAVAWPRQGQILGLGDLPGGDHRSVATAISADGRIIVGQGTNASGAFPFRYEKDAGMALLGAPPSGWLSSFPHDMNPGGSVVVGECSTLSGERAFLWREHRGFELLPLPPESAGGGARAVDAQGRVVAGYSDRGDGLDAIYWLSGAVHTIPPVDPEQTDAEALDVTEDGSLIVGYAITPGGQEPFVYQRGGTSTRLIDFLALHQVLVPDGWVLTKANAIAKNGGFLLIAGAASNPLAHEEAWVVWIKLPPLSDVDGDERTNLVDFLILASSYEAEPGTALFDPRADLDRNYRIDIGDFLIVAAEYGD
jgi:uncharacterized membrane protein